MAGQLYLIGTPIGNLADITERALQTLHSLDVLYCEDTRVTTKLLNRFSIKVQLRSLSDDMPLAKCETAIAAVKAGQCVGFVTDAGMPGLSDPGRRLARCAWEAGIAPVVIPGPNSVGTLLAACPFVETQFRFIGFSPRKTNERLTFIQSIVESIEPVFFFESPHRSPQLLALLCNALEPERELLIGREMTKLHEQLILFHAGEWAKISEHIQSVGEFTIAIAGSRQKTQVKPNAEVNAALARLAQAGLSKRDAVKALAAVWELHPNRIKQIAYGEADE